MFKTTLKVNTKLKLTLIPVIYDYIFSTAINNIVFYQKHLLLLHGDRDLNPAAKKGPNTDQKKLPIWTLFTQCPAGKSCFLLSVTPVI